MMESYEQQLHLEAPRVSKGPGRPAFEIPEAQLRFLFDNNFKATEVAGMFSCSIRIIQRRMKEFNLVINAYSNIDDEVLDEVVRDVAACLHSCGIRSIQSMLRADGLSVQRERVRDSLHRIDPTGIQNRLRSRLHRRQYSVPYSATTNLHLEVHGGIDGFIVESQCT